MQGIFFFTWGFFRHPLSPLRDRQIKSAKIGGRFVLLFPVRIPAGKRLRPFFSKMASASRSRGWREAPHNLYINSIVN
jgi:hypothetical protein